MDERRLAALQTAPPFDATVYDASWRPTPARAGFASVNVEAYRARIVSNLIISERAGGDEPAWQYTFPLAVSLLADVREAGWVPVAVECVVENPGTSYESATAHIYATREVDDAVAAAHVYVGATVGEDEVVATATMPYHTEDVDPWGVTPIAGNTCLDAVVPPPTSVSTGVVPDMGDMPKS